jgi:hypothetical protein
MYNKEKISSLFEKYVETHDPIHLESMIEECNDLIDVIMYRYRDFYQCKEDIKQDVKLKLWQRFSNNPQALKKELISPVTFLHNKIWFLIFCALKSYSRIFGISMPLTAFEEEVVALRENVHLSFKDIALQLDEDETAIYTIYHLGKAKMECYNWYFTEKVDGVVEKSSDELLDPAKLFEVQELGQLFEEEVVAMGAVRFVHKADQIKFNDRVRSLSVMEEVLT